MILRIIPVILGFAWLALATPRSTYRRTRGIPFAPHPKLKLDLYEPVAPKPDAPVIVYIHGGGWRAGSRRYHRFVADAFTSAGYAVAIPDYRLYPEVTFPAFVEDTAKAVRWVHDNLRDADGAARPLVLMGSSAGAHIAALLHFDRRRLAAAGVPHETIVSFVGLCGPYDFLPLTDPRYIPVFPPETLPDSQPITFVDGTAPPALLIAGAADRVVDPANSERLAKRIAETGGPVELKLYPGVGHIGIVGALARAVPLKKPPVRQTILAFLAGR
ncbi:MAG: alpha/beta hydrolase [Bauldia sp.]|nr:alpha/beta hydrolase [Bauldia sp.]